MSPEDSFSKHVEMSDRFLALSQIMKRFEGLSSVQEEPGKVTIYDQYGNVLAEGKDYYDILGHGSKQQIEERRQALLRSYEQLQQLLECTRLQVSEAIAGCEEQIALISEQMGTGEVMMAMLLDVQRSCHQVLDHRSGLIKNCLRLISHSAPLFFAQQLDSTYRNHLPALGESIESEILTLTSRMIMVQHQVDECLDFQQLTEGKPIDYTPFDLN